MSNSTCFEVSARFDKDGVSHFDSHFSFSVGEESIAVKLSDGIYVSALEGEQQSSIEILLVFMPLNELINCHGFVRKRKE
jgi:hypothetical protein